MAQLTDRQDRRPSGPYRRAARAARLGVVLLALAALAAAPAAAEDKKHAVIDVLELYSPVFLAGGPHVTSYALPGAHVLNPALPAAFERAQLDLSYLALVKFAGNLDLLGNVINGGVTLPTDFGTWSVSARYVGVGDDNSEVSDNEKLFGQERWGALNVSFSKELLPDVYLGAGIGGQYGQHDNSSPAWGFGLDLGLFHQLGDLGPLHDVSWGAALRGIGLGFGPVSKDDPDTPEGQTTTNRPLCAPPPSRPRWGLPSCRCAPTTPSSAPASTCGRRRSRRSASRPAWSWRSGSSWWSARSFRWRSGTSPKIGFRRDSA